MSADFHAEATALARREAGAALTPWLAEFRAQGAKRFEALPLPTLKTEAWKYTSLRRLFEADLLHEAPDSAAVQSRLPELPNRLVMVNGKHAPQSSRLRSLRGVSYAAFEDANAEQRALISKHIGAIADDAQHPFLALNEGMTTHGLLIHVAPGERPPEPLHLVHVDSGAGVSRFARVLVVLSPGSALTLVEHHLGADSPDSPRDGFTNGVTEAKVLDNAWLTHCHVQTELAPGFHIGGAYADLEQASRYELHQITIGNRLTRNDIRVRMAAPGASCTLNGIYLCRADAHVDNHTNIEHCAAHCTSHEEFRGIVTDQARAVFNGRIHIHPGAQQSEARLDNRNLLLSSKAEVDTKPELEIYADDVKCAHGATVGELDPDARFYLVSRGIPRSEAENLLVRGFVKARIDEMPTSWLREHAEKMLLSGLEVGGER